MGIKPSAARVPTIELNCVLSLAEVCFKRSIFLYFRDANIVDSDIWRSRQTGVLINVGEYPNAVAIFKKYLVEIRTFFQPRKDFLSTARRRLDRLCRRRFNVARRDARVTLVSVHVRRSDYEHHLSVLYNLSYVDVDYFQRAFSYFRGKFQVTRETIGTWIYATAEKPAVGSTVARLKARISFE